MAWKKIENIEKYLKTFRDEVKSNNDVVAEKLDRLKEFEIFQEEMGIKLMNIPQWCMVWWQHCFSSKKNQGE